MSYNAFSNTSISTLSKDNYKSTTHTYRFVFKGLRPSTKHKMYLEEIDYTWACRGYGQSLGEELLSDTSGRLTVFVLYEIPFGRPVEFEMKQTESVAFYNNKINNPNNRMEDAIRVQWKTFEVKSADALSHALIKLHFHILLVNADANFIEQHD